MTEKEVEMTDPMTLPSGEDSGQSTELKGPQDTLSSEHSYKSASPPSDSYVPQSSTIQTYASVTPEPPRTVIPTIPLTEYHNLQLCRNTGERAGELSPFALPNQTVHINPYKQSDPDPNVRGRPIPRFTCIYDPDLVEDSRIISTQSVMANPFKCTDAASRKRDAIESYTAPSIYVIDPVTASHVSAGELPVHYNYFRHQGGTIKCDECKATGRDEVYKCQHCVAQICNTCIEQEINNEVMMDDHTFTWKGIKLHGAFKSAYLQRKSSGENDRPFEGWINLDLPTGAEYRVYVSIDIVPRAFKIKKRTHKISELDTIDTEEPVLKKTRDVATSNLGETQSSPVISTSTPAVTISSPLPADTVHNVQEFRRLLHQEVSQQQPQYTLQSMVEAGAFPTVNPPMATVLVQLSGETAPRQMPIISVICRDPLNNGKVVNLQEKKE